jgi:spermidine/putrescine transport system permease protein
MDAATALPAEARVEDTRAPAYPPPAVIPGLGWLLVFFLCPFLVMVVMSFASSDYTGIVLDWNLRNYYTFFSSFIYPAVLAKTLRIALITTVLVLLIAYPLAYWLARHVRRFRYFMLVLLILPHWTSYVVRSYALYPLLGTDGLVNQALIGAGIVDAPLKSLLFSEFTIYVGLIYVYLPVAVLPIFLSLDRIRPSLLEAAADLGAEPWASFWRVTLPLSLPGVLGAAMAVFILAVGAYVTPHLLGGPSGVMFANLIGDQFGRSFNWALGSALSVILLIVVFTLVLALSRRLQIRKVFLED